MTKAIQDTEAIAREMQALPRYRVPEMIVTELVRLITLGTLKPNDRLPGEQVLAQRFSVSRNAVREAIKTLHTMGLVRVQHGRGTFVTSDVSRTMVPAVASLLIDPIAATELQEARMVVEVVTAAGAARKATDRDLDDLARILAQAEEITTTPEQWVNLDAAFHITIARIAGNRFLLRMVEALRDLVVEQSLQLARLDGRIRSANSEHRRIQAAIVARDPIEAHAAMAYHLDMVERLATDHARPALAQEGGVLDDELLAGLAPSRGGVQPA